MKINSNYIGGVEGKLPVSLTTKFRNVKGIKMF